MANEKRLDLIDRKALGIGYCNPLVFDKIEYAHGWNCAIEILMKAPTVDAVELPCRPGDHVFRLCGTKKNRYVGERIVSAVTLCGNGSWTIHSTADDSLGKTVFLTREEAELTIAKMDGDGNG